MLCFCQNPLYLPTIILSSTVSVRCVLFQYNASVSCVLFTDTVSVRCFLFTDTVSVNKINDYTNLECWWSPTATWFEGRPWGNEMKQFTKHNNSFYKAEVVKRYSIDDVK